MAHKCRYFESASWDERRREFLSRLLIKDLLNSLESHYSEQLRKKIETLGEPGTDIENHRLGDLVSDLEEDIEVTLDDIWNQFTSKNDILETCPRDVVDSGLCVFHLPVDHEAKPDLSGRFMSAIKRGEAEFVGARFSSLNLSKKILSADENEPIDLRYVTVDGVVEITDTIVEQPFWMAGASIDQITCQGTSFRQTASFDRISVSESISFNATEFGYKSSFQDIQFPAETTFTKSKFGDDTSFERATVGEGSSFASTRFGNGSTFRKAQFEEEVSFENAIFEKGVTFTDAHFGEETSFENARFDDGVNFLQTRFGSRTTFQNAQFPPGTTFDSTVFGDDLSFRSAKFGDGTTFQDAKFGNETLFTYAQFEEGVSFDRATFGSGTTFSAVDFGRGGSFVETTFGEDTSFSNSEFEVGGKFDSTVADGVVDMTSATILGGVFIQPPESSTYYDLTKATLGEVTFAEKHTAMPVLDHYRFDRVNFDGFDFTAHSKYLGSDWILHRFPVDKDESNSRLRRLLESMTLVSPGLDPASVRGTYLKAKNGASQVGDGTAHSEFFLQEMRFRRLEHQNRIFNSDLSVYERMRAGYKWISHWVYNLTCGYGERPGRTVLASLATIGVFAIVYPFTGTQVEGGGLLSYVVFSTQAFVTLLFGGIPDSQPILVRLLTSLEAFFGAFFIALFVFTLTRSLHR